MPENDSTEERSTRRYANSYKIMQVIVFLIIQLILLPLSIIGYIFIVIKVMLFAKKHGISAWAIKVTAGFRAS